MELVENPGFLNNEQIQRFTTAINTTLPDPSTEKGQCLLIPVGMTRCWLAQRFRIKTKFFALVRDWAIGCFGRWSLCGLLVLLP